MDLGNWSFDINFSGSTVVTVFISGKTLVCANVGDSRAILGSLKSTQEAEMIKPTQGEFQIESIACKADNDLYWVATTLSIDHKPDRKDEFEWILVSNGRVDPFREPDGQPIGPARVWLKEENIPGLAMSWSMGDWVASSVGVIPEPEFFELELNRDDKFIVIASDGIWEFIDNNKCV